MQKKTEVIQGWGWREAAPTLPSSSSPAHPGTNNRLAWMIYKHQGERGSFSKSFFFLEDLLSSLLLRKRRFWDRAELVVCSQGRVLALAVPGAQSHRDGTREQQSCFRSSLLKKSKENCVQGHQLDPVSPQQDSGISGAPLWRTLVSAL